MMITKVETVPLEGTPGHALLYDRLRRETDIALNLAQQLQTRAQVVGSTITLLLTAGGIVVGANTSLVEEIRSENLQPVAVSLLIVAGIAVTLSLLAAFPAKIPFTDPEWLRSTLSSPQVAMPLSSSEAAEVLAPVRQRLDLVEVETFQRTITSNKWRGRALAATLALMMLIAVLIAWLTVGLTID